MASGGPLESSMKLLDGPRAERGQGALFFDEGYSEAEAIAQARKVVRGSGGEP